MEESPIAELRRLLSEHGAKEIDDPTLAPAGVMILIYPKDGEYCVLLNKRSEKVEHHKGEISFPGGGRDPEDDSLEATALRETHEEMGIRPEDVQLLGRIDDMATRSRFLMRPYVGTIPYPYDFRPFEAEVAEVLEAPLSTLMDESNFREEVRIVDGELSISPAYAYDGHVVFGATARVLSQFLDLLQAAPGPLKEALWKTSQP